MYNGDSYYGAAPAGQENNGTKKIILIGACVALLIIIGVVLLLVANNSGSSSTDDGEYAEDTVYDSGEDDTGGEEIKIPAYQKLDFLRNFAISDEDISEVESEVHEAIDNYYVYTGYNSINYDTGNVILDDDKNQLTFTFKTDVEDVIFTAVLKLDVVHKVLDIKITHSEPVQVDGTNSTE